MAEYQQLNDVDATTIEEALLKLVSKWSGLPFKSSSNNILWGNVGTGACIGLFALQGAIYKSKYISGSYVGLFPFRIVYKCAPGNNKQRIEAEQLINNLADYLKGYTGVLKGDSHINVQKFDKTSPSFKIDASNDGYEQYTCTMQVEYYYKA